MTEDQNGLLRNFEARVRQLIQTCDRLRDENRQLKESLSQRVKDLEEAQTQLRNLAIQYDNLKMAKNLLARDDSSTSREARQQLSEMVREIDACIALVNEL